RELRDIRGVTILIYEQTCATEKRRRRKRGLETDPKRFAVINELVCEGCGDCSVESNCLSVEPVKTEFGTKRKINLSSCNKDFSCLNGFCPSFVTIEGGVRRKKKPNAPVLSSLVTDLPLPTLPDLAQPYDLLVTGVGGTGVVTVGALITMAAHLENKGSSVLDFTGFAQKFGTVLSYIRLGRSPDDIHQVRIEEASADAVIGCDAVVTSGPKASVYYAPKTKLVVNEAEMPTGDLVLNPDADLKIGERRRLLEQTLGTSNVFAFDANALAESQLGDSVFANVMMLGYAWQKGLVPVGLDALLQAIDLNGVAIEANKRALSIGRAYAHDPALIAAKAPKVSSECAEATIQKRMEFLTAYQDEAYARRFETVLRKFGSSIPGNMQEAWTILAAKSLFKLMAYKDEYEVARLHTERGFAEKLAEEFEPGFKVNYHLSPPFLPLGRDTRGRPNKQRFGRWMHTAFQGLARLKRLRGTAFDPFGWQADRILERRLITWFEAILEQIPIADLDAALVEEILGLPMTIRGFGPVKEQSAERAYCRVAALIDTPSFADIR
ncbi:MAG: DUF6537 domain-containing protein, partial [Pseudomonadota bacterium]